MIASYLHNFIFIKTKKTAGSTVEVTLGDICGPDDIVTPLGPHDELLRGNGKPVCRNFALNPADEEALKDAVIRQDPKAYNRARGQCEFFAHMTATEIKKRLEPAFWEGASKITVERHPYEKAVSAAYFEFRPRRHPPFPEFLDEFIRGGSYATFRFYTINGAPVTDHILRQERLLEDLKQLGADLGFHVPDELRRMKTRSRKDRRPAAEILTLEQKKIVYGFCKAEFELMGYQS